MMAVVIAIHITVCIGLIILVLVQRGKGGGLVENFSSLETMFGTKTSSFLTRSTTILSVIFFITCVSLALLSIRQSKSLLSGVKPKQQADQAQKTLTQEKAPSAVKEVESGVQTTTVPQPQATSNEQAPVSASQEKKEQIPAVK